MRVVREAVPLPPLVMPPRPDFRGAAVLPSVDPHFGAGGSLGFGGIAAGRDDGELGFGLFARFGRRHQIRATDRQPSRLTVRVAILHDSKIGVSRREPPGRRL
jgi:hypothetical protein